MPTRAKGAFADQPQPRFRCIVSHRLQTVSQNQQPTTMQHVAENDLKTWLADHPDWSGTTEAISCTWKFKDFPSVIAFMQQAVEQIETLNHHPEWSNVYNTLTVRLTTHDAGNTVTTLDLELAGYLSNLFHT